MIAPWLRYAMLISLLIGVVAFGFERLAQSRRWSLRWHWFAAIILACIAPLVANTFAPSAEAVVDSLPVAAHAAKPFPMDTALLALWATASLLLTLRFVATLLSMRKAKRDWVESAMDGTTVLLTKDIGPALIGIAHPSPVFPAWAVEYQESDRALMLQHEREHARVHDPILLATANLCLTIMPWNIPLWWLSHRLRLAVEMDCDARVLRSGVDPRKYAALLLSVGERYSRRPLVWAIALALPPSSLQRRIRAMLPNRIARRPVLAIAGFAAVAGIAFIVACQTPLPTQIDVTDKSAKVKSDSFTEFWEKEVASLANDTLFDLEKFVSGLPVDSLEEMAYYVELFPPDSEVVYVDAMTPTQRSQYIKSLGPNYVKFDTILPGVVRERRKGEGPGGN